MSDNLNINNRLNTQPQGSVDTLGHLFDRFFRKNKIFSSDTEYPFDNIGESLRTSNPLNSTHDLSNDLKNAKNILTLAILAFSSFLLAKYFTSDKHQSFD